MRVGELLAMDLVHTYLAARFSTSPEFRRRVAKLAELEQAH
jgi:ribose 5-phosphate isomerase RpiB